MPLTLMNAQTGALDVIEDHLVAEALRSGKWTPFGTETTGIRLPDGRRFDIPLQNLGKALALQGVEYESAEMKENRDFAESGLGTAASLGAGMARSLSLGASDALIAGMGGKETLRTLKEENPWSSMIGEAVGIAGPLVMGGPLGAIGAGGKVIRGMGQAGKLATKVTPTMEVARGVGALPRAAAATGAKAGRAMQKYMWPVVKDSNIKRMVSNRVSQATAGLVESSFYGAGIVLSDVALSREPITAEKIAGTMGATMALGGVLAGAIGSGTLRSLKKKGKYRLRPKKEKGLLALQKRWMPGTLPHVAAVKTVMDLNVNDVSALQRKMTIMSQAAGDTTHPQQMNSLDALEATGEILMDEKFWGDVRAHYGSEAPERIARHDRMPLTEAVSDDIVPPIEKLGEYGIIPKMKTAAEFEKSFADAKSYVLDKMHQYTSLADSKGIVEDEAAVFKNIFKEESDRFDDELLAYNNSMTKLKQEGDQLTGQELQTLMRQNEYKDVLEVAKNEAEDLLQKSQRISRDLTTDDAKVLAESVDDMIEGLPAEDWAKLGLFFDRENLTLFPLVNGVPLMNVPIKTGKEMVEFVRNEQHALAPLERVAVKEAKDLKAATKAQFKEAKDKMALDLVDMQHEVNILTEPLKVDTAILNHKIAHVNAALLKARGELAEAPTPAATVRAINKTVDTTLNAIDDRITLLQAAKRGEKGTRNKALPELAANAWKAPKGKKTSPGMEVASKQIRELQQEKKTIRRDKKATVGEIREMVPPQAENVEALTSLKQSLIVERDLAKTKAGEIAEKAKAGEKGITALRERRARLREGDLLPEEMEQLFPEMGKTAIRERSSINPAEIIKKRSRTMRGLETTPTRRALSLIQQVKRNNRARFQTIKKELSEAPPIFELERDMPTPEYLIDKKYIASQMRETAAKLSQGRIIPHMNEAEAKTYEYLMSQADRYDSLLVAGFDEATILRQYVDTLIPYDKAGKVQLGEVQVKALHEIRTNIKQELDRKMRKVFTQSNPDWRPPPPLKDELGLNIVYPEGSQEARILARNAAAEAKADGLVNDWANFNKMYGVMHILAEGSSEKSKKVIADRMTLRNPWLWGTIIGVGAGVNAHAAQYLTGAIGLNMFNSFGYQIAAQWGKMKGQQASFRRAVKSTERSMDDAVDSLFNPKKLMKKTVRYQAYLAARPDLEE